MDLSDLALVEAACKRLRLSEWTQPRRAVEVTQYTSFSTATLKDLKRADGLQLNLKNIENNRLKQPSMFLPDEFETADIVPGDLLCGYLHRLDDIWDFGTEMACRSIIDAIIAEAIATSGVEFRTCCEVNNDWSGVGFGYKGNVDYMIGSGGDSFLLVVVAKKEWPDSAVAQVLAEAGCLLKNRQFDGKSTPVFAVLTNASFFQFFAIDTSSVVFTSGAPISLCIAKDRTYKSSTSLVQILRWLSWFIKSMADASPPSSQSDDAAARGQSVLRAVAELSKSFQDV
jgi:hypothetical protein